MLDDSLAGSLALLRVSFYILCRGKQQKVAVLRNRVRHVVLELCQLSFLSSGAVFPQHEVIWCFSMVLAIGWLVLTK